jgi:hypothetical protein
MQDKYCTLYELTSLAGDSLGVLINGAHMEVEDDFFELAKDYDLHFTSDMHPMHMHLVNLQCYKEAPINAEKYNIDWQLLNGAAPPYKSAPIIMNQTPYFTGLG